MPTDTVWACAYCPSPRRGCRTLPGRPRPRTRRRRQPRPSGTQPAVLLTGSSSSPSACRRHGHAGTSLGMRVWLTTGTERAHITTHSEARAPRQIGISEGAGLVKWLLGARALGGVDGGVSWWARGRANKPAGSRWSARSRRRGRTTLTSAHARGRRRSGSVVSSRQGREVRTGCPRLVREGRLGCRDVSSPTASGRMVRFGHDHHGLDHISRCRRWRGSHADPRARLRVASEGLTPRWDSVECCFVLAAYGCG
jgi:hypothetical protein